jgi:hypothetical protein
MTDCIRRWRTNRTLSCRAAKIYIPIIERDFHRKMSSQSSQRGRGVNLSPSAMPSSMMRPMKAVKPFTLKGSPTRKSPVCSPTPNAIGHRNSPRMCPSSRDAIAKFSLDNRSSMFFPKHNYSGFLNSQN